MSILQFSPVKIGQAGVQPSNYKMLSNDSLATIMTAGYIKQGTGGQFLNRNDLVETIYNYGTPTATNVELNVIIDTNGVITLNVDLPGGIGTAAFKAASNNGLPSLASVNGATVVSHVAIFNDLAGTITDGGPLGTSAALDASNKNLPIVASVSGSTLVGHFATFADVNGTIQDGGSLSQAAFKNVSDNTLSSVASVNGPSVVGNLFSAADISGTIEDSGLAASNVQPISSILAQTETSNIGGAGLGPYTVAAPGLTASSVVVASLKVATVAPTSAVNTCIASLNSFNVTFTVDPGNLSVLNWIAFKAQQ